MSEYSRRGIAVTLTLDEDAVQILRTLAREGTRTGVIVSRLLHQERSRIEYRLEAGQVILGYQEGQQAG